MYHGGGQKISPLLLHLIKPLLYGRFMVDIFIVLSGFCLMIPVVKSEDRQLHGGFFGYMLRRARRILPPYFAALAIIMLIMAAYPQLQNPTGTGWDISQPSLTTSVFLSHLFLIHNWSPAWIYKIDTPLWSVATEWQIYFLFPVILLPVWRRCGVPALLLIAGLGSWMPHHFLGERIDLAAPWFILLFAMGMIGAVAVFSGDEVCARLKGKGHCSAALGVAIAIMLFCMFTQPAWWRGSIIFRDTCMGIVTMCLLIVCSLNSQQVVSSLILKILTSPALLILGTFSYSVYLVHQPVISLLHLVLYRLGYSANLALIALIFIGVPICVSLARLFYLGFEKPFLRR